MAINPIGHNQYDPYNYSFGSLTGQRGRQVQRTQGVGEAQPMSNPFAANNNESLVGRLDKIDAQTLSPDMRSDVLGKNLYLNA